MRALYILTFLSVILISCEIGEPDIEIDLNQTYEFSGNFRINNESGPVFLRIESQTYYCTTNITFGIAAGQLAVNNNEIEFIDTLFFPVPAVYGPSWVLNGKHTYTFDGNILKLYKRTTGGTLHYNLIRTN